MKIYVVGSGAMGSLFGGLLFEGNNEVTLIDVSKAHIDAINSNGLFLTTGMEGSRSIGIPAKYAHEIDEFPDLILIFTKTIYTSSALNSVKHLIGSETHIMTLQNGLGNVEIIEAFVNREKIIVGMTNYPSDLTSPGKVSSLGEGIVIAMNASGRIDAFLEKICSTFNSSKLNCKITPDVFKYIWEKVAFNAALNTITAVLKLKIGDMSSTEEGRHLVFKVAEEVIKVANRKGIPADIEGVKQNLEMAFNEHGDHMPSMLQDVMAKRNTEIDFINGAVLREAKLLDIEIPVTKTLYELIKVIEQRYEKNLSL
ncbi:ketopantoate reductase family protein [Fusibacter ferrireducens]|uniref:2-dehydropantoate 2-reductase n=1 Tax=Fusibacter ferrireducens TaxID=2785058 RepID=A0ABR9ZNZ1_9FIRM|nr:2-dehydropantoate 2-reductase [Fusibacter ferrireducens]MBF4692195.1 2-dehydropantoate 2-reductase [Fusibacter ferrireducens]